MAIDAAAAAAPDPAPKGAQRGRIFAWVRAGVTIGVLVGLVIKLSPAELSDTFRNANAWLFLAAGALMCVVQTLAAIKWIVLVRARDVQASWLLLARVYCMGNLVTNVLPTAVGGDVYRVYRIQREANARAADVTMSVLYERATGYGAMTCLGAVGAAFYFDHVVIGVLALAGGAAAALILAYVLPRMPFPAVRHDHFVRNLLAHRRELIAVYQMAVFSFAIQALYISTIALLGRAFGIELSWWYWAFTTWVVALVVLAPITLGGLGVRESGFSALAERAGAGAAQGASTGFALGVLLILSNALGLVVVEVIERVTANDRPRAVPASESAGP